MKRIDTLIHPLFWDEARAVLETLGVRVTLREVRTFGRNPPRREVYRGSTYFLDIHAGARADGTGRRRTGRSHCPRARNHRSTRRRSWSPRSMASCASERPRRSLRLPRRYLHRVPASRRAWRLGTPSSVEPNPPSPQIGALDAACGAARCQLRDRAATHDPRDFAGYRAALLADL